MSAPPSDRPWIRPGRAWRWITALVAAWLASIVMGYLVLEASGRHAAEEALASWRESGAPTSVEALDPAVASEGRSAEAWIAGVTGDVPYTLGTLHAGAAPHPACNVPRV